VKKEQTPSEEINKEAILEILKKYFTGKGRLLEIGSGTGQNILYFAQHFKLIQWIASDIPDNHKRMEQSFKEAKLKNVHGPEVLEIGIDDFPKGIFNYAFTANTLHIMSWKENKTLFKLLGKRLREGSLVFFYGPFNYNQKFTSTSNEELDKWIRDKDAKSGIRNFEDIKQKMEKVGFKILKDYDIDTNNKLIVFERLAFE